MLDMLTKLGIYYGPPAIELVPPNKANSWKYPICLVHGLIACLRGVQGWPAATDRHRGVDGKIRDSVLLCILCILYTVNCIPH